MKIMPYYIYDEFVSEKTKGMTPTKIHSEIDRINKEFEKIHGKQNVDFRFAKFKEQISEEYRFKKHKK